VKLPAKPAELFAAAIKHRPAYQPDHLAAPRHYLRGERPLRGEGY
jgi:hypothetical protein